MEPWKAGQAVELARDGSDPAGEALRRNAERVLAAPAFGQGHRGNGDAVADVGARHVDGDVIGDVARGHHQFHLGADQRQNATLAQAGAFFFAFDFDVDEQVDLGGPLKAHQVDVRGQVFDNVALNVAADHTNVVVAFNLEVEQGRLKAALTQAGQQLVERDIDRQRLVVTTTSVKDSREHNRMA